MAGDTTRRGYGTRHQKLRTKWANTLRRVGHVPCSRCGMPVYHAMPDVTLTGHHPLCRDKGCAGACWSTWHLDHTDDRTGYLGPGHSVCNTSAGGRKSQGLPPTPLGTPHPMTPTPPPPYPTGLVSATQPGGGTSVERSW